MIPRHWKTEACWISCAKEPEVGIEFDLSIAAAALFLVSDEAALITGVALPIDGGYTPVSRTMFGSNDTVAIAYTAIWARYYRAPTGETKLIAIATIQKPPASS